MSSLANKFRSDNWVIVQAIVVILLFFWQLSTTISFGVKINKLGYVNDPFGQSLKYRGAIRDDTGAKPASWNAGGKEGFHHDLPTSAYWQSDELSEYQQRTHNSLAPDLVNAEEAPTKQATDTNDVRPIVMPETKGAAESKLSESFLESKLRR